MIHELTIGHLDPAGIPKRRRTVLRPLEDDPRGMHPIGTVSIPGWDGAGGSGGPVRNEAGRPDR